MRNSNAMRELSLFSGAGGGLLATKHMLGWACGKEHLGLTNRRMWGKVVYMRSFNQKKGATE